MKIKINHKIPASLIVVFFLSLGIDTNSDNLPVTEVVLIANNPGVRIVIVLGADHRTFVLEAIRNKFREQVRILPVVDQEIMGSE